MPDIFDFDLPPYPHEPDEPDELGRDRASPTPVLTVMLRSGLRMRIEADTDDPDAPIPDLTLEDLRQLSDAIADHFGDIQRQGGLDEGYEYFDDNFLGYVPKRYGSGEKVRKVGSADSILSFFNNIPAWRAYFYVYYDPDFDAYIATEHS